MSFNLAIQTLFYQALKADDTLTELIDGRVYDFVPRGTVFPYVTLGEIVGAEWDTQGALGKDLSITLHTWSRYNGKRESWLIQDAVYKALHRAQFFHEHYTVLMINEEGTRDFLESDGETRHGVQTFRVLIEKKQGQEI